MYLVGHSSITSRPLPILSSYLTAPISQPVPKSSHISICRGLERLSRRRILSTVRKLFLHYHRIYPLGPFTTGTSYINIARSQSTEWGIYHLEKIVVPGRWWESIKLHGERRITDDRLFVGHPPCLYTQAMFGPDVPWLISDPPPESQPYLKAFKWPGHYRYHFSVLVILNFVFCFLHC